jgi:hypothetical protein
MMTGDQLRGSVLLAVLSQARLALSDLAAAWDAHRRLTAMSEANPLPLSIAQSALLAGAGRTYKETLRPAYTLVRRGAPARFAQHPHKPAPAVSC